MRQPLDGMERIVRLGTVGAEVVGDQAAAAFARLEHDRAGAVAEEHAGVAVLPVDDGGELLRADDEDGLVNARGDELVGGDQRVEESRSTRPARRTRRRASRRSCSGCSRRWRGRRWSPVQVATMMRSTLCGSMPPSSRACCAARAPMSLVNSSSAAMRRWRDAGAAHDPLVRGIDHLFQVGIGEDAVGQVGAGGDNGGAAPHGCGRCGGVTHVGRTWRFRATILGIHLLSHGFPRDADGVADGPWARSCRAP